ncbi:MAG: hypothetical protein A2X36_07290 [Elusimicrobia bacterium GWA2_69_24]|nr:MAG: hypothetical protein A2X36_07290 [Elusimicrobia bacterium GWA2_69_24]
MIFVYEAVNMTLKERFVGIGTMPLEVITKEHQSSPPGCAQHWDFANHKVVYHDLMQTYEQADADYFIQDYKQMTPMPGWRMI